MANPIELRIKVIEALKKGKNVADVAKDCKVSVWTARRWLKKFEEGGLEHLTQPRPSWNITPGETAKKVYLLKEKYPRITLFQARERLLKQKIRLSLACIRKIWQRYGLAGYNKRIQLAEIIPKMPFPLDVAREITNAGKILEQDRDVNPVRILKPLQSAKGPEQKVGYSNGVKKAAQILNRLPYCGGAEILDKIPYQYLGLRRKVEKLLSLYGKEPLDNFFKRARALRLALEKKGLFYSSLRVGIAEVNTLLWLGRPKETNSLIKILEKRLPKRGDVVLSFFLALFKGMALAKLLKLNDAIHCANECKRLVKMLPNPTFYISLGSLYSNLGMYGQAKYYYEQVVQNLSDIERGQVLITLAGCYVINGEYQKTFKTLNKIAPGNLPAYTFIPLVRAQALFGQGMLTEAAQYAKTAIEVAKKNEVLQYLHNATMVLATIYYVLGEKKRAKSLIQSITPLLKKNRMMPDYYQRRLLLNKEAIAIPKVYQNEPMKLILLIKKANQTHRIKDYNRAFNFAVKKGLKGYFHRLCVFYPELVLRFLKKGKPTGLPGAILRLPVFNKEIPVYHIKFLGNLVVFKNQEYVKTKLRPKDSAFLIYLCFKAMEPGKSANLADVYNNFWARTEKPSRNFSHLLMRVKKTLKIPSHLLTVSRKYRLPSLANEGVYFTTDYQEFEQVLSRAKALEWAGEWGFARKEYLRAYRLFRGEPFKKMYDRWSENMRRAILNKLETEVLHFSELCMKHNNNKRDAKRVFEKAAKIIPNFVEIRTILKK
jgi:tetratricopeptide (TPR) repeat protein